MGIFLDTGFYFALLSKKDAHHDRATKLLYDISDNKYGLPYSTIFVLNESLTLMNSRTKGQRLDLLQKVRDQFLSTQPIAQLVPIREDWMEEIFQCQVKMTQSGDAVSFTDASNVIVCQKMHLAYIISFDGHFKGFLTSL